MPNFQCCPLQDRKQPFVTLASICILDCYKRATSAQAIAHVCNICAGVTCAGGKRLHCNGRQGRAQGSAHRHAAGKVEVTDGQACHQHGSCTAERDAVAGKALHKPAKPHRLLVRSMLICEARGCSWKQSRLRTVVWLANMGAGGCKLMASIHC